MGTPDFAVPALEALIREGFEVCCVYSQPPRPKGRGQQVQNSPVHEAALKHGIEVRTPKSLKKDPQAQADFAALGLDAAVVAAYGLILPKAVLDAPEYGCLNIHASLLPRWRGASPIQHAVWKGDRESGVGIMQMEEGLDTGPVLQEGRIALDDKTTAQRLHDELSALGAKLIVDVLKKIEAGKKPAAVAQDDAKATYAPLLSKDDGRVKWDEPAEAVARQVRALNPWPGVWTMTADGKRMKILAAEAADKASGAPGTVSGKGLVACGGGTALRLVTVQPENAKAMDAASAANGGYLAPGALFS
jgi:methionyl-tRNA formyltransferase